jgi:hypothetical protein
LTPDAAEVKEAWQKGFRRIEVLAVEEEDGEVAMVEDLAGKDVGN